MENSTKQQQIETLKAINESGDAGYVTTHTTFAMIDLTRKGYIKAVACEGPLMAMQKYDSLCNHDVYEITHSGKSYLASLTTSAAVAITDTDAIDTTPSEVKANDGQPSASEPVLSIASYDALLYIYNIERGLISVQACDSLTRAGLITPVCMQGSQWLVKSNDAGREYVEKYLLAKEAQPVSGWLADALATVNVTDEAIKADDFLPPTVEELEEMEIDEYLSDYDPYALDKGNDLPFSDLGEDEIFTETHSLYIQREELQTTIASLEARVKELEGLLSQVVNYNDVPEITDGNLIRKIVAALYEVQ